MIFVIVGDCDPEPVDLIEVTPDFYLKLFEFVQKEARRLRLDYHVSMQKIVKHQGENCYCFGSESDRSSHVTGSLPSFKVDSVYDDYDVTSLNQRLIEADGSIVMGEATLNRLILYLTDPHDISMRERDVFIQWYPAFSRPRDVAIKLLQRLKLPSWISPPDSRSYLQLQRRVLSLLVHVVRHHYFELHSSSQRKISKLLQRALSSDSLRVIKSELTDALATATLERATRTQEHVESFSMFEHLDDRLAGNPVGLYARALTVMECELVRAVTGDELAEHVCTGVREAGLGRLMLHSRIITAWLVALVLRERKLENRVRHLVWCSELAQHLLELNNYHGLDVVCQVFRHPNVMRLQKTWAAMPQAATDSINVYLDYLESGEAHNYILTLPMRYDVVPSICMLLMCVLFASELLCVSCVYSCVAFGLHRGAVHGHVVSCKFYQVLPYA
eukprot:TRINITY_DN2039_c0_g1_i3.p1 TRINITY_DN2039_c0_g1~~TRINITY_DN2039_c0_g1_i3.p1  ORF type:complete len:446 (-),score=64.18 TRINITY_DN2039_c0_g1_i3:381-1718(-)